MASACTPCPPGRYSSSSDTCTACSKCEACIAGRYSQGSSCGTGGCSLATACSPCTAGTYSSSDGAISCSYCPVGRYSDYQGAAYCDTCPPGKSSADNGVGGATSADMCLDCPAGKFSRQAEPCQSCPAGKWSGSPGASVCTNCAPGKFSKVLQATSEVTCTFCPEGTSTDQFSGSDSCTTCSTGTYAFAGSPSCSSCDSQTYIAGVSLYETCIMTPPCTLSGLFASTKLGLCQSCAPGRYNDQIGGNVTSCSLCPRATFGNATGMSTCFGCPPGTFGSNTSSLGSRFQDEACTPCGVGTHASNYASVACSLCGAGTYEDNMGSASCDLCPRNTFSPSQGCVSLSECIACPKNKITALAGSTDASMCFDPIPNFVIGGIVLVLSLFAAWKYTVLGRFHRVAFLRRYRVVLPSVHLFREVYELVETAKMRSAELEEHAKRQKKHASLLSRALWVLLWLFLSALILCGGVFFFFLLKINQVIFAAMIIYRGLLSIYAYKMKPFLLLISASLEEMLSSLPALLALCRPFVEVYSKLAHLDLNLGFSAVGITCSGAKAPYALFLNLCILGFVVIIIESDTLLAFSSSFSACHEGFQVALFKQAHFAESLKWSTLKLLRFWVYSGAMGILTQASPLNKLLQWVMGFLTFSPFVESNGVHAWSESCQGGPYGTLDKAYAVITTLCAFFLTGPALYAVGRLFMPKGMSVLIESRDEAVAKLSIVEMRPVEKLSKIGLALKFLPSLLSVDLYMSMLQFQWINSVRRNINISASANANASQQQHALGIFGDQGLLHRILLCMFQSKTTEEDENFDVRIGPPELPPYKVLCDVVYDRFEQLAALADERVEQRLREGRLPTSPLGTFSYMLCGYQLRTKHTVLGKAWNRFISFTPLGHMYTNVGLLCWACVYRQYACFTLACFGFWTPYAVACFDVKQRYDEIASLGQLGENKIRYKKEQFSRFLSGLIGPRAILFQIVPPLAVLSIFAIQLAPTPIFFPVGEGEERLLNDYLITAPFEEARRRLKEEEKLTDDELERKHIQWMVQLEGILIYFSESRGIQIVANLLQFALTLSALFPDHGFYAFGVGSLVLFLPQAMLRALKGVIYLGKYMGITDNHLRCRAEPRSPSPADDQHTMDVIPPPTAVLSPLRIRELHNDDL